MGERMCMMCWMNIVQIIFFLLNLHKVINLGIILFFVMCFVRRNVHQKVYARQRRFLVSIIVA